MKTLNKEQAVKIGGNIWVKDDIERVYLSVESVNNLIVTEGYSSISISKKMKQAKTFLNTKNGELISDVGAIRSALNGIGYTCNK